MYAVVSSGGKQYRVEPGTELTVERVAGDAGSTITFDRVLLVGDGEAVTVGTPTVEGASVSATVLGEALGPKLIVFKFKQKATYRRKNGHRQHLTRVRIDEISAGGKRGGTKAEPAESVESTTESKAAKTPRRAATRRTAKADAGEAGATSSEEAKPKATRRRAATKKAESTEAEE